MNREELRQFIIGEIKTHRPEYADRAEVMANQIMNLPNMQSEAGIRGFLKGYLSE